MAKHSFVEQGDGLFVYLCNIQAFTGPISHDTDPHRSHITNLSGSTRARVRGLGARSHFAVVSVFEKLYWKPHRQCWDDELENLG